MSGGGGSLSNGTVQSSGAYGSGQGPSTLSPDIRAYSSAPTDSASGVYQAAEYGHPDSRFSSYSSQNVPERGAQQNPYVPASLRSVYANASGPTSAYSPSRAEALSSQYSQYAANMDANRNAALAEASRQAQASSQAYRDKIAAQRAAEAAAAQAAYNAQYVSKVSGLRYGGAGLDPNKTYLYDSNKGTYTETTYDPELYAQAQQEQSASSYDNGGWSGGGKAGGLADLYRGFKK